MARAKREHEGFLATWTAAVVVAHLPFTATAIDANQLNPFREVSPEARQKLDEVKALMARLAFTLGRPQT